MSADITEMDELRYGNQDFDTAEQEEEKNDGNILDNDQEQTQRNDENSFVGDREKISLNGVHPIRDMVETDELAIMVANCTSSNAPRKLKPVVCTQFFDLICCLSGAIAYIGAKGKLTDTIHPLVYHHFLAFVQKCSTCGSFYSRQEFNIKRNNSF